MSYCFSLAYLSTLYCDKFQALISPPFNRDHSLFHTYMYNWGMSTPAYDPSPSFLELFIIGPIGSVLFQKDCVTNDNRAFSSRVVTKISSCQVNTTSRRGIKQLGILFGSIFFYFPIKVAGENPRPPALNDNPAWAFLLLSAYSFISFFFDASHLWIWSLETSFEGNILSGSFLLNSLPNISWSRVCFVTGWGIAW